VFFSFVTGNGGPHRWQGRGEGKKTFQILWFSWSFLRRRVNPRAASGVASGEDVPPLFLWFRRTSLQFLEF